MSTLVAFHAHPDDESLIMGGTFARAAAEGHRTVLVVATNGDHGQVPSDLAVGETLVDRRQRETQQSCDLLGVQRIVWLGYSDSGMTGWEQNGAPEAFINANTEVAAQQLANILQEEHADVFVTYDWHGNYGHPDHLQVHKVGHRAAQLAHVTNVFEVTTNRDHLREIFNLAKQNIDLMPEGTDPSDFDADGPADDGNPMGEPAVNISHKVDITNFCEIKRKAIASHASQVTDTSFFAGMSDEIFQLAFGSEWFIKVGESGPPRDAWLFD